MCYNNKNIYLYITMADTGLPQNNPWLDYETQPTALVVQGAQERKTWLPNYIQTQVDDIMQESKERKENELKIQAVFNALENRYTDFDRTKFNIKVSWLTQEDLDYLGYWVFLLYSKDWKLLSYIKDNWETILDMTTFDPYWDNTLAENIDKYMWFIIWVWEDWKWFIQRWNWKWEETRAWKKYKKDKIEIFKQWDTKFDRYIIWMFVLKE